MSGTKRIVIATDGSAGSCDAVVTAGAIVESARAHDADLIVVGSWGLGAVAGAVPGSVSRAVPSKADRCVLVVKGR